MTRLTAKDFAPELLELYDHYVHGKSPSANFSAGPASSPWAA